MKNALLNNKAQSSAAHSGNLNKMSTATEAQYARVLQMLRLGRQNTMQLRRAGVMMPAARIKELNDKFGYTIATASRITLWDEWGFPHRAVAEYELRAEPINQSRKHE
jgi:hypothetical protein